MICQARKTNGEPCKAQAINGKRVCRVHGGATPGGLASPHYQTGKYSRCLPARMAARYEEAVSDPALLELRGDIALVDARLADLLGRVDTGESGALWARLMQARLDLLAYHIVEGFSFARFMFTKYREKNRVLPVVTFFVEPDSGCAPLDVRFTNTTDPGMIGGCVWTFGDGMSSTSCGTEHSYEDSGTYTVSLTVNSPAGCEGDTTLYHLVHVDPSPTANFTFGPQPTNFYQPEVTFVDASSNDVILWSWHFPEGSPDTASSGQVTVSYPNDDGGSYPAQLVVSNRFGCTDTLLAVVAIDGVHSVYAPNAFTPDGDGVDAVFLPMIRDYVPSDHDMRIFDRWGREVFRTTDPGQGWDGSVDGAGPKTDVYVRKLRSRNRVDGIMREYIGHVTVPR